MTVTINPMHAGHGVEYLLRTVAVADGDRSLRDPLTRYYTEQGTPLGYWLGSGIAGLDSELKVGDEVAEEHLRRLIGHGQHPVSGEQLGSRFRTYKQPETGKPRKAVAGFDMTFSIPKSASILWAVADAGTQAIIAEAHHRALAEALDFVEREIVATRAGAKGPRGAVVQCEVTGVVATAFDHYDSRANDPHLHTHVVIANRVKTVRDGKWRTLDGTPLHHWTVAVSELHEAIFSDHLTRALGVGWERRARGRDRNPAWEVTDVPHKLVTAFSQRSRDIDAATEAAIEGYVTQHGQQPKRSTINKLRQTANLTTRPPKHIRSLADLTAGWRRRATDLLGEDATTWGQHTLTKAPHRLLRADDIPLDLIDQIGRDVVIAVGEKRSTWRRANLYAETARQTRGWRFATTRDREAITGLIVEAAEQGSLRLTPPDLATTPAAFTRTDGSSQFRPKHSTVFSAEHLLAAEDRLLKRADAITGPTVDIEVVDTVTGQPVKGHRLSPEQAKAIAKVAVSGRQLDLLVGPAGAGKHRLACTQASMDAAARTKQRGGARPECRSRGRPRRGARHRHGEHREVAVRAPAGSRNLQSWSARHHRRSHPRRHSHARPDHPASGTSRREGAPGRRLGTTPIDRSRRRVRDARRGQRRRPRAHRHPPLHERMGEARQPRPPPRASRSHRHLHRPRASRRRQGRVHDRDRVRRLEARHRPRASQHPDRRQHRHCSRPQPPRPNRERCRPRASCQPDRRHPGGCWRLDHHPPERSPPANPAQRVGPQRRPLDGQGRTPRRLTRRTPPRPPPQRSSRPTGRVRRGARRPRLRDHGPPRPGHHRRHLTRRGLRVHDAGEPVRRGDPRPRPQPRLRHHR